MNKALGSVVIKTWWLAFAGFWGRLPVTCPHVLALLAVLLPASLAAAPKAGPASGEVPPGKGDPAAWVAPLKVERLSRKAQQEAAEDRRCLLFDRQIHGQERKVFNHYASQMLTATGVQNGSKVSVEYDPVTQKLTWHWLRVWRGSNALDRLDLEKMKLLQPERDLDEWFLFTGEKAAVFLLEDVRVGDIVDYAWTLEDTVVEGLFTGHVLAQTTETVERLRTRLIWPSARKLFQKNHGAGVPPPSVTRKGTETEMVWDFRRAAGVLLEDNVPGDFEPLAWVQLSEYPTWAEVNQWALRLFPAVPALPAELRSQIEAWRRQPGPEAPVRAALQFVQDDIRYLGIETGTNSYKPTAPGVVFQRRYGDCKDKTWLLVTILKAMGVEAYPVLVHTRRRESLAGWHPSPSAFNHAIVRVRLNNKLWWLDPTRAYQRGPLSARYLPDYAKGLVLMPGGKALSDIPPSPVPSRTTVQAEFRIQAVADATELVLTTLAEGAEAERWRAELASGAREGWEKSLLNERAAAYPAIRVRNPPEVHDDTEKNEIEIVETYSVNKLWTRPSEAEPYRCRICPFNVAGAMVTPGIAVRSMPWKMRYPNHQVFRAEVILPQGFAPELGRQQVVRPEFEYHREARLGPQGVVFESEYQAMEDQVAAPQVEDYIGRINDARESLDYLIVWW